jgi:hypothetical protein
MFIKYSKNLALAALVTAVFAGGMAGDGLAGKYKKSRDGHIGYVTAYSQYGNGSMTAPVRTKRNVNYVGKEVMLPGGVWIDCAISCAETLRSQKIDFFEEFSNGGDKFR